MIAAAVVAACSTSINRAPVEDRPRVAGSAPALPASDSKPAPGAENAGKPGFVTVKPGDTLIRISIDAGQNWRDVARWNNIETPDALQVGQVLRVAPPPAEASAVAARPVTTPRVETRPLDAKPTSGAPTPTTSQPPPGPTTPVAVPPVNNGSTVTVKPPAAAAADTTLQWSWPAAGTIGSKFEEQRSKGITILGKAGDPVAAAAFGRVMYVGTLRGYGNIVIVQHNNGYLSVYGNIRTALVAERQAVTRGQRIAEMGNSEAERMQLHFEIRKDGEAVDPLKLLPQR